MDNHRTFNEKEITAMAKAFRTYMGAVNGTVYKTVRLLKSVRKALEGGLGPDVLLNKYNWGRAMDARSGKDTTPEQYVEALLDRSCAAKKLGEEPDWQDDWQAVRTTSQSLHEWFKSLRPIGGTWRTSNAQANITQAVSKWGLQPIMDESLIEKAEDARRVDGNATGDITFFGYIALINQDRITPDTRMTEDEARRAEEDEALAGQDEAEAPDGPDDEGWEDIDPLDEIEAEENGEKGEPQAAGEEPGEPMDDVAEDEDETPAIIQYDNPMDTKRSAIAEKLNWMTARQIAELSYLCFGTDAVPLGDIIEKLTFGEASKEAAKNPIYESLRLGLMDEYLDCLAMQGFPTEETEADKHDIVSETWDMRDPKAVMNHKLQKLIYEHASEDEDLMNFARSLNY